MTSLSKSPHALADELMELSQQYSLYSGELAKLTKAEGEHYERERPNHKSDTAVARAFQISQDGVRMTIVKLKLQSISKEMSAIKTMIEVATNEARGLY